MMVHVAGAGEGVLAAPYSDGSWPPLRNTEGIELAHDPKASSASGRVSLSLAAAAHPHRSA